MAIFLIGLAVAIGVAMLAGCCKTCPPPKTVVVAEPAAQCLTSPPPVRPALRFAGPEDGCPSTFEACLSLDDTLKLRGYIASLADWTETAWLRCGPSPKTP